MSRVCEICKRGPQSGNNVSHSERKTRRKWHMNLQSVKAQVPGRRKKIKVCTRCLKSGKVLKAV
ncbi:MAG TPA: 50S ribosomal protein L28 [Candidatus Eremiobacteraeota bacterium]|nr:MAG: 50S ribosomal protein L28 [bacterium ADurb.Bin363]HPZ10111.1 50S ribosomal protein L28 [Candidatus Eremiobacteraeota bacterium]